MDNADGTDDEGILLFIRRICVIRGQSLLAFGAWDLEPAAFGSVHGLK